MENRIEEIKRQFIEVLRYSQEITNPQVDELFETWWEAKKHFIEIMNGNLIYECPETVSFELDEHSKTEKVNDFINRLNDFYGLWHLANFVDNNKENFYNNLTTHEYLFGEKLIPANTRILKDFKFFIQDKELLERIQNEASRIIQENKVEGKLCLSVHPLDFLSSSENTHNWRSCHALDGEYRSGNLSYMVDKSTIMCYLKSNEDTVIPNFPREIKWNSKKWRMLLFFSNDGNMLFAGRQYPFSAMSALNLITENLLLRAGFAGNWSPWGKKKISKVSDKEANMVYHLNCSYIPMDGELIKMSDLIIDGDDAMNFNDLLRSSCYDPYYCSKLGFYGRMLPKSRITKFIIGGPVKCIDCGKETIRVNETMRCTACEEDHGSLNNDEFGYCECCGRHFYLDDALWVNDEPICPSCVNNGEVMRCENCGEWYFKEDMVYDHPTGATICRYCND